MILTAVCLAAMLMQVGRRSATVCAVRMNNPGYNAASFYQAEENSVHLPILLHVSGKFQETTYHPNPPINFIPHLSLFPRQPSHVKQVGEL